MHFTPRALRKFLDHGFLIIARFCLHLVAFLSQLCRNSANQSLQKKPQRGKIESPRCGFAAQMGIPSGAQRLAFHLVHHLPVAEGHSSIGLLRHTGVMRHSNQGLPLSIERPQ